MSDGYTNEEIKENFEVISDEEFRKIVAGLALPKYLYGDMFPEEKYFKNERKKQPLRLTFIPFQN